MSEARVFVVVDRGADRDDDAERHPIGQLGRDAVPEGALQLGFLERPGVEGGEHVFAQRVDVDASVGQLLGAFRPDVARKPGGDAKEIELARAYQVQRPSHQRGLVHELGDQRRFELVSLEIVEPRPQADVWRGGVLRLHAGEPLDRGHGVQLDPLEKHLPGERPAIQLPQGDGRPGSHGLANLPAGVGREGYLMGSRMTTGILREVFF